MVCACTVFQNKVFGTAASNITCDRLVRAKQVAVSHGVANSRVGRCTRARRDVHNVVVVLLSHVSTMQGTCLGEADPGVNAFLHGIEVHLCSLWT